jgi:hypothetical protein
MKKQIVVVEKQHPHNKKNGNDDVFILEKSDNFHNSETKLGKLRLARCDGVNFVNMHPIR